MAKKIVRAAVLGAAGRMGQHITDIIAQNKGIVLAAAIERPGHPLLGKEFPCKEKRVVLSDNLKGVLPEVDVVIDFTSVSSTLSNLAVIATEKTPLVIGTTGFSPSESEHLRKTARGFPCVFSPNMSIGVNLLFKLVGLVARMLRDTVDVEITEVHHHLKKDAPSGTALRLAQIIAENMQRDLADVGVYGRKGLVGERRPHEIGIHALRAGDIIGEHTVLFAGTGERLEIIHRAHNRENFANGAIRAALWIVHQAPGLYTMEDVLGFDKG